MLGVYVVIIIMLVLLAFLTLLAVLGVLILLALWQGWLGLGLLLELRSRCCCRAILPEKAPHSLFSTCA